MVFPRPGRGIIVTLESRSGTHNIELGTPNLERERRTRTGNTEPGTGNITMHVLLMSMPDSFEHTPTLAVRMPNGGLASLAGNVDPHHQVAIADLVLVAVVGPVHRHSI